MYITFFVLKLETSSEVRPEQLSNIWVMFVTFSVLKLETSSDVRLEQFITLECIIS